uniref:Uncharacterized protein n=1 Tax=Rhizophora mucronata TaxID=61149 RepID=A0A2P2JNM7_RHIMU
MSSMSVLEYKKRLSVAISMRSALFPICSTLSSPDTYTTGAGSPLSCPSAIIAAICNTNVLFPTPGSPPTKTKDPGTRPPPSTLATSLPKSPNSGIRQFN